MGAVRTYANGEHVQPADLFDYIAEDFPKQKIALSLSQSHPYIRAVVPGSFKRHGKIRLAPLYDVQFGSKHCDVKKFERHINWIRDNPEVLTWLGGDIVEYNTKLSVGTGVYEQDWDPENQVIRVSKMLARIRDRILFAIPGNHEARGAMVGHDAGKWYSSLLQIPYFGQPVFCDIVFNGRTTALYAWHGRGASRTDGAITNVAVSPLKFVDCDLVWMGHLHQPRHVPKVRLVRHPEDLTIEEREVGAVISPSYLQYFNSYAATAGFEPAPRGLIVCNIYSDGTWEIESRGKKRQP